MNQENRIAAKESNDNPVWLITGCFSGLGRALAELIVNRGWRLVATARRKAQVTDLAERAADRVLALDLDITVPEQITAAVAAAVQRFGRIDVLVNNAGYGYQSTVEEGIGEEIRAVFDANVFGLFAMTRSVLPVMLSQRSGCIINITSVVGLIGYPGSSCYAASKHAVEDFSDSLSAEVEPLGIGVTCVESGPFRTEFAGRSLHQTRTRIADYEDVARARQDSIKRSSGTQSGDPVRAGEAMIALSQMAVPPRHLPLGVWGYDSVLGDRRRRLEQLEGLRAISVAADFPSQ